MKIIICSRTTPLLILALFAMPSLFSAEKAKKDVTGYDDLEWGSTLEQVKTKYPGGYESKSGKDADFPNSKRYIKTYTAGLIEERAFTFYNNTSLAQVRVTYRTSEMEKGNTTTKLIEGMLKKFGEPTDRSGEQERYFGGIKGKQAEMRWDLPKSPLLFRLIYVGGEAYCYFFYSSNTYAEKQKEDSTREIEF